MSIHLQTKAYLTQLQTVMFELDLWQTIPPKKEAFASTEPFSLDTMTANEWLQWVFIPRMQALLDSGAPLPTKIAVSPYIEEALKETIGLSRLLQPLIELEALLQKQ